MRSLQIVSLAALCSCVLSQSNSGVITLTGSNTRSAIGDAPTRTDLTYNTNPTPSSLETTFTYTFEGTTGTVTGTLPATSGNSTAGNFSTTPTATILSGTAGPTTLNGTNSASNTATDRPQTTNTTPCNGYPELCYRKYSNITHVAAHNSPFAVRNNVASNQALDVTTQLNDGIRMLQFQVHQENGTFYLCHSSCDLLNAGTLVAYLTTVREWLEQNRYDVITILMGNSDFVDPTQFVQPIADAGLLSYAYTPNTVPMALDGWPTLGEMIILNKRVVFMLDYEANQDEVPWLLDEFSYLWETPFSPTDRDFPCTVDRPPEQEREISEQRMNMANHNLNIAIEALGLSILVPAYNLLAETNALSGYGSAGAAVANCTVDWGRPPTFLLVDYYNLGSPFNGSVMAVAAAANGVSYDQASCCGTPSQSFAVRLGPGSILSLITAAITTIVMMV